VKIAFSDHGKCDRVFGTRAKRGLDKGITAMAAWCSAHGARQSSVFENIEIPRNLPPSWAAATQAAASRQHVSDQLGMSA